MPHDSGLKSAIYGLFCVRALLALGAVGSVSDSVWAQFWAQSSDANRPSVRRLPGPQCSVADVGMVGGDSGPLRSHSVPSQPWIIPLSPQIVQRHSM